MDKVRIIKLIEKQIKSCTVPIVTIVSEKKNPFLILVSCILSLRTKDKTTVEASKRLFSVAKSPREMLQLSFAKLSRIIYPVGFYRKKSKVIFDISASIIRDFKGKVPNTIEGLLSLKGVGRKTANLVLGLGYAIAAICVDTHVHRISNRLGWVKTDTPEQTEIALQKIIPKRYWIELNTILVTFGQNICLPISPLCSSCLIRKYCKRTGVGRWR